MTNEQINNFIHSLNATDFNNLREFIKKEEKSRYDEMWWTHNRIDNYLYYVYYKDGSEWMHCIAKKVYDEYISNENAICIKRKTKDLFPTWETLMEKKNHEQKGLRS